MKKKNATYFLLALLQLFFTPLLAQQSITAVADKSSILLGEPLTISISITGGQAYKVSIPDSLGRFEVLEKLPPTSSTNNGTVISTQQIVVTSFDSGPLRIPPIAVEGNASIVSGGIDVMVNTVPPDAKLKYGDIKQIIDPNSPAQWPYIAALGALAVLSAFMIYRLNRKYQQIEAPEAAPIEIVSTGSLLQQIEQLKKSWEQQEISALQLGNSLMDIFKKYLAGKGIPSTSKTGEELIMATKSRYEAAMWQEIVQTIRLCNAMRFGKFRPEQLEGTNAINAFKNAITLSSQNNKFQPPAVGS